ncbi:MAG: branched-chain-amino-acid transaminase [Anaerolineales bacterium]|nr:branched-chain-amino-acid transaminase [Anaerolineales bacterium]
MDPIPAKPCIYVNGEFCAYENAKISVFDHGFVYGDGIFEGIQVVDGLIFKLEAHVDRLFRSAQFLKIEVPLSKSEMTKAIISVAHRAGLKDGYIRPVVSRGAGPLGMRNMSKLSPATVVIIPQNEDAKAKDSLRKKGITAHISSIRRIPTDALDSRVKSCNYINNILAYLEALECGADTAIMLDATGHVCETHGSNIFVVRDGALYTPPVGNILDGITRQTVFELCAAKNMPCSERDLTLYDLITADEVFETATMIELMPITRIDGYQIAAGKVGPMSQALHSGLRELMKGERYGTPIAA